MYTSDLSVSNQKEIVSGDLPLSSDTRLGCPQANYSRTIKRNFLVVPSKRVFEMAQDFG
jgi:hypothetical protein